MAFFKRSLAGAAESPLHIDIEQFSRQRMGSSRNEHRLRHRWQKLPSSLLVLLLVVSNVQSSLQDSSQFEFVAEPEPSYYTIPDAALIIPCRAEELLANDTRQTVSTTMFVDSFTIAVSGSTAPADRYLISPDGAGNMIGLIILQAGLAPVPSVVRCSVVIGGQEVCTTGNSTIIIGDGRPLPPAGAPYHMMDGFRSVQLQWDASTTPSYAGILNYVVTYWLRNQTRNMAVNTTSPGNGTVLELRELAPGGRYNVVVQGTNAIGQGDESPVGEIMTTVGEVPPVPTAVDASVQRAGQETTIRVSWMAVAVDLATMTPVRGYVVSISNFSSPLPPEEEVLADVDDPSATAHTFTVRRSGVYRVGVASRNLAGQSEFVYFQQELNTDFPTEVVTTATVTTTMAAIMTTRATTFTAATPTAATPTSSLNLRNTATTNDSVFLTSSPVVTIIAIVVAGVLLLVVLSIVIFAVIFYMRLRIKRMDGILLNHTSIESPPPKKKAESSLVDGKSSLPGNTNNSNNLAVLGPEKQELVDEEKYQSPNSRERRSRERSLQQEMSAMSQQETRC